MKTKKWQLGIVISVFITILLLLRVVWINHYNPEYYPVAEEGVIDLRDVHLTEGQVVALNGSWEFYNDQFIELQDSSAQIENKEIIQVPGNWSKHVSQYEQSTYGYGTYRLKILLSPEQTETVGFYFGGNNAASTVFVNGEKIHQMGVVAQSKKALQPNPKPFEVQVDAVEEIDLLVHVANFNLTRSGGIVNPIRFGTTEALKRDVTVTYFWQLAVATILFLQCIYLLSIYIAFSRKQELLYLAAAFFSATISVLVDNGQLLLYMIDTIDYEFWRKLVYLSYVSTVYFLLRYFERIALEENDLPKAVAWVFKGVTALYFIFIISVFIQILPLINFLFTFLMLTIPMIIALVLIRVFTRGKGEMIYLLLAVISVTFSILWGSLSSRSIVQIPYYPFEVIIGIIFFALFWFKRFFQAIDESEQLTKKLQMEIKRKDDFLANTSHELRNPLHGIINIAQTILEDEKNHLSQENKKSVEILLTISRRMSMIINDLLDSTKLKENGIQLQIESVNVNAVIASVFDMLRYMKEGKDLTFHNAIPNNYPLVKADEKRLFQILFNLVHNAVKFSQEGEIRVTAEVKGKWAVIHVQDEGIGVDEVLLSKIFTPYEQADSSMTAIAGGIGLGLAISEQLVQLHSGELTVVSEKEKGAIFTFTLPLAIGENPNSLPPIKRTVEAIEHENVQRKHHTTGSSRILVVDDDPLNLSVIERVLHSEKYDVLTCTNGEEALKALREGKWDLVITDVMMPGMSGYELTSKIRKEFTISELPILILTARSQLEDVQMSFQSGANDYVTKPIEKQELISRVQVLINLKQSINERVRMEGAWLQAQIQPHFLFNTLNTIAALSHVNPSKMLDLLEMFGQYLHSSFMTQNLNELVPLLDEVTLVEAYVFIQQQRFAHRLSIEWEYDDIPEVEIPPLVIQTLVENAINHGVLKRPEGGTIQIQLNDYEHYVEVIIQDDGVGMDRTQVENLLLPSTDKRKGIGLSNTNKRLMQLFGKGLEVESELGKGTKIRFELPK